MFLTKKNLLNVYYGYVILNEMSVEWNGFMVLVITKTKYYLNSSFIIQMSQQSMRECRKAAINSQKMSKDCTSRAKRLSREMVSYWKRFEKVEKDIRKKAEKEAQEQRKMDLELREVSRLESFNPIN